MELVIGQNSYMTVAEADEIVTSNFISTSTERKLWNSLDETDKAVIIVSTTTKYDSDSMCYIGYKDDVNQRLQFPRVLNNGEIVECPDKIKIGLIMQALKNLQTDSSEEAELISKGVKSFADGSGAKIEFSETGKDSVCNLNKDIWNLYFRDFSEIGKVIAI